MVVLDHIQLVWSFGPTFFVNHFVCPPFTEALQTVGHCTFSALGKLMSPLTLAILTVASEEHLNFLVAPFHLSMNLRMGSM